MKFSIIALSATAAAGKLNDEELLELGQYELVQKMAHINYQEPISNQISHVQAKQDGQFYDNSDDEETEEEAARFSRKEQDKAKKYAAHPHNKARFEFAKDACKNVPEKKRKACFTRNWRLYKPHHSNTIFDFRARAHRKCWQYKNAVVKLHDCFAKYIKTYEGEIHQLLLGQAQSETGESWQQLAQQKSRYVNRFVRNLEAHIREISTASSEDSHDSESSSNESSDPDYQTTGVGERKAHHPRLHPQGADSARRRASAKRRAAPAKKQALAKKAPVHAQKPTAEPAENATEMEMNAEQRPSKKAAKISHKKAAKKSNKKVAKKSNKSAKKSNKVAKKSHKKSEAKEEKMEMSMEMNDAKVAKKASK